MSVLKSLFFQGLEGLTEAFGRMSAGISGQKLPLWAEFSFLTLSHFRQIFLLLTNSTFEVAGLCFNNIRTGKEHLFLSLATRTWHQGHRLEESKGYEGHRQVLEIKVVM